MLLGRARAAGKWHLAGVCVFFFFPITQSFMDHGNFQAIQGQTAKNRRAVHDSHDSTEGGRGDERGGRKMSPVALDLGQKKKGRASEAEAAADGGRLICRTFWCFSDAFLCKTPDGTGGGANENGGAGDTRTKRQKNEVKKAEDSWSVTVKYRNQCQKLFKASLKF